MNLNEKDLETIQAVQSDTLREIAFEFYATDAEDAVQLDPDDFTVKFNVLKPDNNFVMTTFTDGIIKLTINMTAVTGTGYYCIMLMQDDDVIYSGNGKIVINDHVIGAENIDSVSEADGLVFPDDFYTRDTPIAEIDDSGTSDSSTWSSSKIAEEIAAGSGADLIDDLTTSTEKTWSSSKISAGIAAKASIDDNTTTQAKTWSSDKIATELAGKPDIDDTAQNYTDTWSSEKINSEIQSTTHIADNVISSSSTWSSQKISDEISAITPGGSGTAYDTTEQVIGTWVDGRDVYRKLVTVQSTWQNIGTGANQSFAYQENWVKEIDFVTNAIAVSSEQYAANMFHVSVVTDRVNGNAAAYWYDAFGGSITSIYVDYVILEYVKVAQ